MNGLDAEAARQTIERGQRAFIDVFGEPARTFLPPAWQRGRVRLSDASSPELRHVLGFLSLDSSTGRKIPLATYTWDCSRWAWPGYVGHGVGRLLHSMDRVPTLAIHPRDVERGFWPTIRRLTQELLDAGYEPATPSELMGCSSPYSMPSWTDERVS